MNIIELADHYNFLKEKKDLQQVIFYRPKGLSPFQEFVLKGRLWSFIKLKILFDKNSGDEFITGFEEILYEKILDDEDYTVERRLKFGPTIIKLHLDKQQVIDLELNKLDFRAIIHNAPFIDKESAFDSQGDIFERVDFEVNPNEKEGERSKLFFLSTDGDLILMEDRMYCTEALYNYFKDMVNYHNKEFEDFLKNNTGAGIPHEVYVNWLQKMFPGKIQVRSLT